MIQRPKVLDSETDNNRFKELAPAVLSRLNDFFLERFEFGRSRQIHALVTEPQPGQDQENEKAIRLLTPLGYLAPLLIVVPVGTLLVLDIGTAWNQVMDKNWQFWGIVITGLTLSYATLAGSVARRTAEDISETRDSVSITESMLKVLPVFAATLILAMVYSFVLVLSLVGTSATVISDMNVFRTNHGLWVIAKQTLLWGSMSLFLGIFLGLIAQGRGLYKGSHSSQQSD